MSNPSIFFDMLGPTGEFHFERLPDEAKGCVICLHGFSGSPWETRPVAESLFQHGFAADCPLHPAHGLKNEKEAKQQMKHLSATQLIENATRLIEEQRQQFSKVYLYGQSLGAILTLYLMGLGLVDGAAVTVPPLKLPMGTKMVARLSKALNFAPRIYKPRMERGWSYEFISGASALCIFDLIKLTREVLPQINVPLLGCFSKKIGSHVELQQH